MIIRVLAIIGCFFLCIGLSSAQFGDIQLINPSFEGQPRKGEYILVLRGWTDCGQMHFRGETPPDVLPVEGGWENNTKPIHGNTFIAMVVRDNDSWEAISQELQYPMQSDSTYEFSIALMQSKTHISPSRLKPDKKVNFNKPTKLRIWGGDSHCNAIELIGVSPLIKNHDWQKYTFEFNPTQDHKFIIFEAMYDTPYSTPYNGHILLDMASTIKKKTK